MLSVGFVRRWYARRLVKFLEKSRKKHRRLPDHMVQVDTLLRRVPEPRRAKVLEEMLRPGPKEGPGRELRRAASRQQRQSGKGGPRRRPGMPPQTFRQQQRGPR